MITVAIIINGQPIYARTAVNMKQDAASGESKYHLDDGSVLYHHQSDGAIKLAKRMLNTIQAVKKKP